MPDSKGQVQEVEEKQPEAVSTSKETKTELPEEVSERTKEQYDKLLEHNRQLAEENKLLKSQKEQESSSQSSVFDSLRPQEPVIPVTPASPVNPQMFPSLTPAQVNQISQGFIDKDGYLNEQALNNALADAQRKAERADQKISQLENKLVYVEENSQVREAHSKYPSLNPRSAQGTFDPKFYEAVKNEVVAQMIKGEPKDLMAAADKVNEWYSTPKVNPQVEVEAKKKEEQVAQINATSKSAPGTTRYSTADQDTLVKATQKGSHDALMERLKRAGY